MWFKFSAVLFLMYFVAFSGSAQASPEETTIKAITFDFGGVIAKSNKAEITDFIAQYFNISKEEGLEAWAQYKKAINQGIDDADFWLEYANSKGVELSSSWLEQLGEVKFNSIKVTPGMIELVKELQHQGYPTALLSNVAKSQAEIKRKLGYYELFDPLLLSYEIGIKKPDPKAYHILLERLQIPPKEILFIDNAPPNVEAAKSLGFDAILFTNTQQLIEELKQRGIEVASIDLK